MAAGTVFAVGDRVTITKPIRMHTHNGVFERPAGYEGEVVRVSDSPAGFPVQVDVRFGHARSIGCVVAVCSPDDLLPAVREEGNEHA